MLRRWMTVGAALLAPILALSSCRNGGQSRDLAPSTAAPAESAAPPPAVASQAPAPVPTPAVKKPVADAGTRVEPVFDVDLVSIPGGTFHFGCEPQDEDCQDDERLGRSVSVPGMWLGKTEVTVEAYARCVAAGACTPPASTLDGCNWGIAGREQHPINCVDWTQASAFCARIGGRLPTAEEWEYAAKGGESRIFPWGDAPVTGRLLNYADEQFKRKYPRSVDETRQDDGFIETAPVGSFPLGASKHGLLDMAGNVAEWTSSDSAPASDQKEVRGGSWSTTTFSRRLRASYRTERPPGTEDPNFGFRCRLPGPKG